MAVRIEVVLCCNCRQLRRIVVLAVAFSVLPLDTVEAFCWTPTPSLSQRSISSSSSSKLPGLYGSSLARSPGATIAKKQRSFRRGSPDLPHDAPVLPRCHRLPATWSLSQHSTTTTTLSTESSKYYKFFHELFRIRLATLSSRTRCQTTIRESSCKKSTLPFWRRLRTVFPLSTSSTTQQKGKRQQACRKTFHHRRTSDGVLCASAGQAAQQHDKRTRCNLAAVTEKQNDETETTTERLWTQSTKIRTVRSVLSIATAFCLSLLLRPLRAVAAGGGLGGGSRGAVVQPLERRELISLSTLWIGLFTVLALLHAAEIAITTLYPWKVREIAEEEEKLGKKRGVFKILNEDITRVLTTILVTSTACSIFATTLFTHLVSAMFGTKGERYGAFALTGLTLFFVELLPKSLGVTKAEVVARLMVPPVNVVSAIVSPLGITLSWLAKRTLYLLGVRDDKKGGSAGVSDSQLRLIVTGALDSGTIDPGEQEMIQGVLNLQDRRVKEIMRPRVEMVAVPCEMSVVSVLSVVRESGYSRIPVYDGEIDNIVGIILAKGVLDFFVHGVLVDDDLIKKIGRNTAADNVIVEVGSNINGDDSISGNANRTANSGQTATVPDSFARIRSKGGDAEGYVRTLTATELASRMEKSIKEAGLIESCYFVPDTANGWSVLQEMRRRRVHLAIVVDEFGGTEGLVSLEDIVEQVVGDIYDEDDEDDFEFSEDSITMQEDGSFLMRGDADLEDVNTILSLSLSDEEALKEFATLSGFLCKCAGEIPRVGDFIMSRGWTFDILSADEKKILLVRVERLIGAFESEENAADAVVNPLRNLLRLKGEQSTARVINESATDADTMMSEVEGSIAAAADLEAEVEGELQTIIAENISEAKEVEKMVEAGERKMELLEAMRNNEATSSGNDTSQ